MERAVKVAAVQAEPVWFDMEGSTDKVISLVAEAAGNGAELVAFPETFIPGYPWQIWTETPAGGMRHVPAYHANSPRADGPQIARIAEAARTHGTNVVVGYSERGGNSLYMSQVVIDETGRIAGSRRKLKPTHVERAVFGEGDGSDLVVHDLSVGKVGALNCWEHLQPLTKYAMFSMGEEIHVGAWPTFSVYRGAANALGPEVNTAASLTYAVEGQCFVVAPCGVIGDAGRELFCDTPEKEQLLGRGGGFARIYGPEGSMLAEPLPEDEEGILYATCEPALHSIAKSAADPVGHYSRPDVTRLLLNRRVSPTVVNIGDDEPGTAAFAEPALMEEPA